MNETLKGILREKLDYTFKQLPPYAKKYMIKQAMSPNMIFLREHCEERILHPKDKWEEKYELEKERKNCRTIERTLYELKRRKNLRLDEKEIILDYLNFSFKLMKATNPLINEEK